MEGICKLKKSFNISQIKSKNTKQEILIRKFLFALGFRFRIHDEKLTGKPEIVFPKHKTIIMVNGCFWHGHENCEKIVVPRMHTECWTKKNT